MLAAIRAFAKSWVAKLLLALVVIAFAIVGIEGSLSQRTPSDAVIVAGERKLTPADFKRAFDNEKRSIEQRNGGQALSLEMVDEAGFDKRMLDGLSRQEAFFAIAEAMGIRPSDKLTAKELSKVQAFFDPVTGKFDKAIYAREIGRANLTPAQFERLLADQIAEQHIALALAAGVEAPRAYTALAAIHAMEARDFGFFAITPAQMPPLAPPTEAQLKQFMNENADQLRRPELRILSIARFSPALVSANLPIDEAELKKRYEFRRDTVAKPETRTLVQIPAKDAAAAAQIAARLGKGEAPEAIAKSLGVEAIHYADKPKTAIADRHVADAAFALSPGQVSGPIRGDLGFAVVKLDKISPGQTPTLEQLRPELEAEVRKDAAGEKVYAQTQAYDEARESGASLAEAAQKAGAAVVTLPPLSKEGVTPTGQPLQGMPPKILESAFALPAGGESELVELGDGEYVAIKVEKVIAPAMPPLDELRPRLTQVWMSREMLKRMQAKAEGLVERLRKGESLEAVASSAGAQVTRALAITRASAGQNQTLSQDALAKGFDAKPGAVFIADHASFGLVVAKVEAIRAGQGPELAQLAAQARPQMSQALARELLTSATGSAVAELRREKKLKVNSDLARAAIGLEPEKKPAAGKEDKAK
jgi:peptidyl-prolyl cis-trans isomerase D